MPMLISSVIRLEERRSICRNGKSTAASSRKERDSNPRYGQSRTADFESAPIDHSGIFPLSPRNYGFFRILQKCEVFFYVHAPTPRLSGEHRHTCF